MTTKDDDQNKNTDQSGILDDSRQGESDDTRSSMDLTEDTEL